jgi:transcriptional regulator with XRE-family HTH domain
MIRLDNKKIQKLRLNSVDEYGKHISVLQLSKDTGVTHGSITRMENDESYNPGVLTLFKISEYFKVRIDDLIVKG